MTDAGFARFEHRARKVKSTLADDFLIVIFGPYAGICEGVMGEIAQQLRRDGYSARVCKNHPDPSFPSDCSDDEKNWLRSKKCLEDADAAIFIFFETVQGRFPNWDPKPAELNSSVIREMSYWIDALNRPSEQMLAIFEGELRDQYGSLIPGSIEDYDCREEEFERNDFEELYQYISSTAWKWVFSSHP